MSDAADEMISDVDRDSLFILPLAIIPLKTPALRRARLIKNVRLNTVVELFDSPVTGSGQIDIEALPHAFEWREVPVHEDLIVLRQLAILPSFDVYSLRVLLRQRGIPVNDFDALRLSKKKNQELTSYMTSFTRPLIRKIYGDDDVSLQNFEHVVSLFRDPDVARAREKLKVMAERLEITIDGIPAFLEDYGDLFLSFSYYRSCRDHVQPMHKEFADWLDQLTRSRYVRSDKGLIQACRSIDSTLKETMQSIDGRFQNFDFRTRNLWNAISARRFREFERMIKSYHTTIGGVLCALTVKMEAWAREFPNRSVGGPQRRAKFVMSDIREGIDTIRAIEAAAPRLSDFG